MPNVAPSAANDGDQLRKDFTDAIAQYVPSDTLETLVTEGGIVKDFDILTKAGPSDPGERRLAIASAVVNRYGAVGRLPLLAGELLRRMRSDDLASGIFARFLGTDNGDSAQEARLALRAHKMQSRKLRDFMAEVGGRVCAVTSNVTTLAGRGVVLGTGFLVSPDLVLTAYHNIEHHVAPDGTTIPGRHVNLVAYFDFFEGATITYDTRPSGPAIAVAFAEDWLVKRSNGFAKDGMLSEEEEKSSSQLIAGCLDFALVRLSRPIGRQTLSAYGGTRRGWVDLSAWQNLLTGQERIVMPQHPEGDPQNIDFGSYIRADPSGTRLRYTIESERGTSGAPCFVMLDSEFHLVGMHNATYKPSGIPEANQAVDIKCIREMIDNLLGTNGPSAPTRIWNTSPNTTVPRVVLHRDGLLDWIEAAQAENVATRRERLYAAVGQGSNIGKTYSIDILRAACRSRTETIVVLGSAREAIPSTASDFLAAIADQLSIPRYICERMPTRPSADAAAAGSKDDKLIKWASDDLPQWFNEALARHRSTEVDRQKDAAQTRDFLRQKNFQVPADIEAMAQSPVPLVEKIERWSTCWIVIDGLAKVNLPDEVHNLIAGLTGGNLGEESLPKELRRLRWLFLGGVPSYIDQTQVTRETLDPMAVGTTDAMRCLRDYLSSIQCGIHDESLVQGLIEMWETTVPEFANPADRLPAFQRHFQILDKKLVKPLTTRQS